MSRNLEIKTNMAHHLTDQEYKSQKRAVWRATIILSIATIVEITLALLHFHEWGPFESMSKGMLSILMIVLSLLKAFYIVGEFMHVKYEVRALALTILVPLVFLIYGVVMFMWEGAAWKWLRDIWA